MKNFGLMAPSWTINIIPTHVSFSIKLFFRWSEKGTVALLKQHIETNREQRVTGVCVHLFIGLSIFGAAYLKVLFFESWLFCLMI